MSWNDFLQVVDFYEASGVKHMYLVGGDPLLHSRILDILALLQSKNFSVQVGTSAVIPASLVDRIRERQYAGLKFGVNSTLYFHYGASRRAKVDYFLRNIDYPLGISYTLHAADLVEGPPLFILDRIAMICKFGLKRHLTIQVAAPAESNADYIPFDRYRQLIGRLKLCRDILGRQGISCAIDCHSIPLCVIREAPDTGLPLRTSCEFFPVDIGPDLSVWPCFPLSELAVSLDRFRNLSEAQDYFMQESRRRTLCFDESCDGCPEREDQRCSGGCLGFQLLRRPPVNNGLRDFRRVSRPA
jgi:MoaA/NifB/PqqE/SkfB family radical SAM enzyme